MSDQDNNLVAEILNNYLQLYSDLTEKINDLENKQLSESEEQEIRKIVSTYRAWMISWKILGAFTAVIGGSAAVIIALYELHEFLNKLNP